MTPKPDNKRLILGIGTGRCGTRSLACLLDLQSGVSVSHEDPPVLPWQADTTLLETKLERLFARPGPLVGDVASSWLPYLPTVLERHENTRVICLWRERETTIASFRNKMKGKYNHWMAHDGSHWRHNSRWDPCFPKYPAPDLESALGLYWDEYQAGIDTLQENFPDQVRRWPVDSALNSKAGLKEILDFSGIAECQRVYDTGIRENRGRTPGTPPGRRLGRWLGLS